MLADPQDATLVPRHGDLARRGLVDRDGRKARGPSLFVRNEVRRPQPRRRSPGLPCRGSSSIAVAEGSIRRPMPVIAPTSFSPKTIAPSWFVMITSS